MVIGWYVLKKGSSSIRARSSRRVSWICRECCFFADILMAFSSRLIRSCRFLLRSFSSPKKEDREMDERRVGGKEGLLTYLGNDEVFPWKPEVSCRFR